MVIELLINNSPSKINKGIAVRIKSFKVLQAVLPNVSKEGKPTYITAAKKHVKKYRKSKLVLLKTAA